MSHTTPLSIVVSLFSPLHHHHTYTTSTLLTPQSTNRSFFNGSSGFSSGIPVRSTSSSLPRSVAMDMLGQGGGQDAVMHGSQGGYGGGGQGDSAEGGYPAANVLYQNLAAQGAAAAASAYPAKVSLTEENNTLQTTKNVLDSYH